MSSLVLGAVGATVGLFAGGPAGAFYGFGIGYGIGALRDARRVPGAQVGDLRVTGSAYGEPIPWVRGSPRIAGQIIWASDKRATPVGGGKGGMGSVSAGFSYEVDVLYLLADGDDIVDIAEVFSNGKLIWTQMPGASIESINASINTTAWRRMTFYRGLPNQLPDPTYEAAKGVGNAPANRGRATVMVQGLQCGTSGQLPNLQWVLVRSSLQTVYLRAPLTADRVDTIAPAATLTSNVNGTPTSVFSVGGLLLTGITSGNWRTDNYSGTKVRASTYTNRVVYSLNFAPLSTYGTVGGSAFSILRISGGTAWDAAWLVQTASGAVTLTARHITIGGVITSVSAAFTLGVEAFLEVEIRPASSGDDVIFRKDGTVVLTISGDLFARANAQQLSWGLGDQGGQGIASANIREVRMAATGTSAILSDPLRDIVAALCDRAGMPAGSYDVSGLPTTPVRSLAVTGGATRAVLEQLSAAYFIVCWTRGSTAYFGVRGGSLAATIPASDLAAAPNERAEQPLAIDLGNELELPPRAVVTYINISNDWQTGSEPSDRMTGGQAAVRQVTLGVGMTPKQAKGIADAMVSDAAAALVTAQTALPLPYAKLDPSDVVSVVDRDGRTYRMRLERLRDERGVLSCELVGDDPTVIVSAQITDETQTPAVDVRSPSDTVFLAIDMPLARDVDDGPGYYVAAKGSTVVWPGGQVHSSADNVSFSQAAEVNESATFGTCATTLGNFTGIGVDEVNTLTVNVGNGTLASSTRDAMLADETINAALVGDELVRFVRVTMVSAGIYTLSGFLRGQKGTEWAIGSHAASERFVLLTARGMRRVTQQISETGSLRYLKSITLGATTFKNPTTFTNSNRGLKPLAVAMLRASITDSVVTLTWARRSRFASRMFAGSPLGEVAEAYDVELRDGGNVLRYSGRVSTPSYTASGWIDGGSILLVLWGLQTVGGQMVAVHDPQAGVARGTKCLVVLNSDGTLAEQSPDLGEQVYQWTNSGDAIFAAIASINTAATPSYFVSSRVVKMTRGTLASLDATNTAATPGDYAGIAHDGTNLWVSERTSGNLRKLNASTLASVAAYAITGTPTALAYSSGKLWLLCEASSQLVKWDIGTQTEDARISLGGRPADIMVASGKVYVSCTLTVEVYDEAAATLTASYAYGQLYAVPQRTFARFGSYVVASVYSGSASKLLLLTASTGALAQVLAPPMPYHYFAAGEFGGSLYVTGAAAFGSSLQTRRYTVAPPNLSGYTATVWQVSDAVGRGYPTSIGL